MPFHNCLRYTRLILPVFSPHNILFHFCSPHHTIESTTTFKSLISLSKHAFIQDSRRPCPRCIYCIPRPVCARSVRLPLSLNRDPGLPDLLNLSREIRGQALSRREPVRRAFSFKNLDLMKKLKGGLKGLALMTLVGGVSSEAGSAIYKSVSKPVAGVVESGGGSAAADVAATGGSAATRLPTGELSTTPGTTSELTTVPTNGGHPPTTPLTTSGSQSELTTVPTNGGPPPTTPLTTSGSQTLTTYSGSGWTGKPSLNRFFQTALLMVSSLSLAFKARSVSSRDNLNR